MSPVATVLNPEIEEEQSVSINIPGAYVSGIDTNNDGNVDVNSKDISDSVNGTLVIDQEAKITSENGQNYTADSAPVIINTGAQGYSSQETRNASGNYAKDGYINVEIGNRGKQDSITENGSTVYTGDAPSCLVDQKNAVRYVRYNILLGNLPGSSEYFVSTGGSGGGAHAVMLATTANNEDFYPYEIEAGAVGCYRLEDGSYSTKVQIGDKEVGLSDGIWGCVAYSPITSLKEADMAQAFEYNLNSDFNYNTDFQKKLASYLSESYMEYVNSLKLTANEADLNIDLNGNGTTNDQVKLSIEYDPEKYPETNGYGGSYINYYLQQFESSLNNYLNNLDCAEG